MVIPQSQNSCKVSITAAYGIACLVSFVLRILSPSPYHLPLLRHPCDFPRSRALHQVAGHGPAAQPLCPATLPRPHSSLYAHSPCSVPCCTASCCVCNSQSSNTLVIASCLLLFLLYGKFPALSSFGSPSWTACYGSCPVVTLFFSFSFLREPDAPCDELLRVPTSPVLYQPHISFRSVSSLSPSFIPL